AGATEISDTLMKEAFGAALAEIEKLEAFQKEIVDKIGKPKAAVALPEAPDAVKALFRETIEKRLLDALFSGVGKERIHALKDEWLTLVKEKLPEENALLAAAHYEEAVNSLLHTEAIKNERRPDGMAMNELRPLSARAGGISSVLHGTGIFYRGGTHILSVVTLGGPQDAQIIDGMETKGKKRFMHHYNFPPFSVGETGRMGGTNRRMIGHGALAEKALVPVIPPKDIFPYTIRIVSEVMSSNGSSSMGSVCGGTVALMDAGVPIKTPVAGIAMGLMMEARDGNSGTQNYKILTDIQGPEDEHGDMDFKVAGTKDGITAVQMDVKVEGVPLGILMEAFEKAREARLRILDVLTSALPAPRPDLSPAAPRIFT
ncbi:MAG: polyribonucleotide nucleotidyltransferase, partial [Patescibacteria group bacterium]